jgi:nitrogen fixation NifU-like protein
MYSERLLDHFQNPRNVGELEPPAITVEVTNPACGDILRLSALITDTTVTAVAYKVRGCTASIAAGSALTTLVEGKSMKDLAVISLSDIEGAVDGLPPESKHAGQLALDALRALIKRHGR